MKIKKIRRKNIIKILILAIPIILAGLLFSKETLIFLFILSAILLDFMIFLFPSIKYFGVELITVTIILIGFVYGSVAGATAGFILLIFHLIVARYSLGTYITWLIPEYVAIGFVAGTFKEIGLINLGIYSTIGINAVNVFLSLMLDNSNFSENLIYSLTNVAFNIFLFIQLGSFIPSLI
jgi:hypothetical protein